MFIGFDYGTSNCAMAALVDGRASLIPLYAKNAFVPSTLYALDRSFIADAILQHLPDENIKRDYAQSRMALLRQARSEKIEHDLQYANEGVFFGDEALEHYIAEPGEGYFIKSPKSFLGTSGLRQASVDFFEDVVALMMLNVKTRAEQYLQRNITQVVIGRPINFQGINAEESNRQAQAILTTAAGRAGFVDIEFLYEPLAAGFDFETRLTHNKRVLVVDVGGGTTDCSMVLMGPGHCQQRDRRGDFLGHSGERVGGNDFDIQLAQNILMPQFGMLSVLKSNLPMPLMPFINAVAINNIGAQAEFYDLKTGLLVEQLLRETTAPELLARFATLRNGRHNFALVRAAEMAKIALSSQENYQFTLDFIEHNLAPFCSAADLARISEPLLQKIAALIIETTRQAGAKPDIIYITGGSAKSPLIRQLIGKIFGQEITIIDGDHFGSVAAGLAVWAGKIFR